MKTGDSWRNLCITWQSVNFVSCWIWFAKYGSLLRSEGHLAIFAVTPFASRRQFRQNRPARVAASAIRFDPVQCERRPAWKLGSPNKMCSRSEERSICFGAEGKIKLRTHKLSRSHALPSDNYSMPQYAWSFTYFCVLEWLYCHSRWLLVETASNCQRHFKTFSCASGYVFKFV